MNVAIVTPLYPPDVADTATYVKELATRLSKTYTVTILTYGYMPERIANVTIVRVNKRSPLLVRIVQFSFALFSVARKNDVLYIINGPSVELPLALASFVIHTPFVFHIRDTAAHAYTRTHMLRRAIETLVQKRARRVVTTTPKTKPEVLPFVSVSPEESSAYEASWHTHMAEVTQTLS